MKVHADEFELARAYTDEVAFESLTPQQVRLILNRGRELHLWFKSHTAIHSLINVCVIVSILAADWLVLWRLPQRLNWRVWESAAGIALIVGAIHSWFIYSLGIFSLHEGAAHQIIFPGKSRLSRTCNFLSENLCRFCASEPQHYSDCHMSHHARFGTKEDSEFLNFVRPRRLWLSLLPLAAFVNFTDFLVHRPLGYTRGRAISAMTAVLYNGAYTYVGYRRFGPWALILPLMSVHFSYYLDRLRQFTEHNLMPVDNVSGSRNFGLGFWGLLIGGGPWGQPCHFAHHLVPSVPWYQQIILHRYMVGLFTKRQRSQFLLKPVVGYPLLLWTVLRDSSRFSRRHRARVPGSLFEH